MKTYHDAALVVDAIWSGDVYVGWEPGDGTLYRLATLRLLPLGLDATPDSVAPDVRALLAFVGAVGVEPHLLLPEPTGAGELWTAPSFLRRCGARYAGWWSGLRPVLAALGWTPKYDRRHEYDPTDGHAMARLAGGRPSRFRARR